MKRGIWALAKRVKYVCSFKIIGGMILKRLPAGGRDQTLLITPGNPDSSGR